MKKTRISWSDSTWNYQVGCSRVSRGCRNCYAERDVARTAARKEAFQGLTEKFREGPRWTGALILLQERIEDPLRWTKGRKVFVNSISDFFHEDALWEVQAAAFAIMSECGHHTFQILTKRPQRAIAFFRTLEATAQERCVRDPVHDIDWHRREILRAAARGVGVEDKRFDPGAEGGAQWPLPNVHIGVSVEDRASAARLIPLLFHIPAAVRWVSAEPLLEEISLLPWVRLWEECTSCEEDLGWPGPAEDLCPECGAEGTLLARCGEPLEPDDEGEFPWLEWHERIDWVVIGGESGPGARPFYLEWAEKLITECGANGVPCFMKQVGSKALFHPHDLKPGFYQGFPTVHRAGANPEEWPEGLRVQQWPGQQVG